MVVQWVYLPPVRCFHVPFGLSLCETPPWSTMYRVGLTMGGHCPGGQTPDHLLSYTLSRHPSLSFRTFDDPIGRSVEAAPVASRYMSRLERN